MTTGAITTGAFGIATKRHYFKSWTGTDGRYTTDVPPVQKWNAYEMVTGRFRSTNPNQVGNIYVPWNSYSIGDNAWGQFVYGPLTSDGLASGSFWNQTLFDTYWTANEELKLLSKLADKVRGHSFDMGVAIAESGKFAGTVANTLKNLVGGIWDLKNRRFTEFARRFGARPPKGGKRFQLTHKDVSARFLEMRYAWEPAIKDVYEAAKAFEAISNGPRKIRFKSGRRVVEEGSFSTNWLTGPLQIEVGRSYLVEMLEQVEWSAQLGLNHPGNILWELLPWSFVADWFIPIGTYLSNLGVIPALKGRWSRTSYVRQRVSGTKFTVSVSPDHVAAAPYPDVDLEIFRMQRLPLGTSPTIPFPTFKVAGAIQGKRVANAVALLHQTMSRFT
jgi:hypothetical protein